MYSRSTFNFVKKTLQSLTNVITDNKNRLYNIGKSVSVAVVATSSGTIVKLLYVNIYYDYNI